MKVTKPGFLNSHLAEIEEKIRFHDQKNPEVSKVNVAWHLDHMLKTVNQICKALETSDPSAFKASRNLMRNILLALNYIPRGKAQSPAKVRPPEIIHADDIQSQLDEARQKVSKVFELDRKAHFAHPVFGTIAHGQALRFIEVHTNHHLKIVRDIIK